MVRTFLPALPDSQNASGGLEYYPLQCCHGRRHEWWRINGDQKAALLKDGGVHNDITWHLARSSKKHSKWLGSMSTEASEYRALNAGFPGMSP